LTAKVTPAKLFHSRGIVLIVGVFDHS